MPPLPVRGTVSHDAPRSGWDKRRSSLEGKQTERKRVLHVGTPAQRFARPNNHTFVFDVEGVIQLAARGQWGVSKYARVKGQLQDSLPGQDDLRVLHQLQAF